MDKKGVMVEEWKARRKEWKKKRWKKREKGKSGFGKSPFCFCLTVCFASSLFSLHPPHHHATTHALTHLPHNMTHWCTPSHANRAMCCAALFWEWTARHTLHHPHPTASFDITQHTQTNQTQTQLMAQATKK